MQASEQKYNKEVLVQFPIREREVIKPKQAGGSESMYSLGKKALENRYRVEMHGLF